MRAPRSALALVTVLCTAIPAGAFAQARTDWKHGAVCYEIFVRSFFDSDGDGIGDLNGVIAKLDYVNDGREDTQGDLGARCIWLMPVAESPSYHGYDVTDYYHVDREYGSNADFRRLIEAAHRRGIRVLVDLVLNHTSSEHPWFQQALRDTASPYRNWYVFRRTPGARNPWGGDNWHRSPFRDEFYYGFFWSGMPDLNFHTPAVLDEAKRIATFWLHDMGVDGFRLDAVPFLVEEDGRVVHTAGTHAVLREIAAHVRRIAPGSFTIGEVWDSTAALLPYYPDQLDAYFAFDVSQAILDAVRSGDGRPMFAQYRRLLERVPQDRWAPFLRNHDQTRTMTVVGDAHRAAIAATLLLTLPGVPFVYYGEEIGMSGDKPDERLRTPMQWSDAPGAGFTRGTPWEPLPPDWARTTVQAQARDSASLLTLYRRLIHLRARNPALAGGALLPLSGADSVIAFVRSTGTDAVLVVANLTSSPRAAVQLLADLAVDSATIAAREPRVSAGSYRLVNLLGGSSGRLTIQAGPATRFVIQGAMPAMTGMVFGIVPAR